MFTQIDHIALHVSNLQRSLNFYKTHFVFQDIKEHTTKSGHLIIYLKLGNTILELGEFFQGSMEGGHFCVHTDNFQKDYAELVEKRIPVHQAPHHAFFRAGW